MMLLMKLLFWFVMILINNPVSCNLQFIHNALNINFNIVLLVLEGDFIQNLVFDRLEFSIGYLIFRAGLLVMNKGLFRQVQLFYWLCYLFNLVVLPIAVMVDSWFMTWNRFWDIRTIVGYFWGIIECIDLWSFTV